MSLLRSRPLRQKSDKAIQRDKQLSRVKLLLLKRAGYKCELCGNRDERLDLHHVFGRSGLGAWNDSLECVACLCRPCHERVTSELEPQSTERLLWDAAMRLAWRLAGEVPHQTPLVDRTTMSAISNARSLVARLDAAGVEPA